MRFGFSDGGGIQLFLVRVTKEVFLDDAEEATKHNRGKDNQRQRRCHNDVPVLKWVIDTENEAEGDGAADHAGEPDEDLLFDIQTSFHTTAFRRDLQKANCSK